MPGKQRQSGHRPRRGPDRREAHSACSIGELLPPSYLPLCSSHFLKAYSDPIWEFSVDIYKQSNSKFRDCNQTVLWQNQFLETNPVYGEKEDGEGISVILFIEMFLNPKC